MIQSQKENPKGLHVRYHIQKIVPNPAYNPAAVGFESEFITQPVDADSEYFILRLDEKGKDPKHIKAGRIAINAYANAIEQHLPLLAAELRKNYPLLSPVPKIVNTGWNSASLDIILLLQRNGLFDKTSIPNKIKGANLILDYLNSFNSVQGAETEGSGSDWIDRVKKAGEENRSISSGGRDGTEEREF